MLVVIIVKIVAQWSERWDCAGCHCAGVAVIIVTVIRVLGSGQCERVVMEKSRTPHLHWHCQEDGCGGPHQCSAWGLWWGTKEGDGGECVCCGGCQHERGREVVHRSVCLHTRCGRHPCERGGEVVHRLACLCTHCGSCQHKGWGPEDQSACMVTVRAVAVSNVREVEGWCRVDGHAMEMIRWLQTC